MATTYQLNSKAFFGGGLDGDVTIGSFTTLTDTQFYRNLTINDTLNPNGHKIFCSESITLNNASGIDCSGGDASVHLGGVSGIPSPQDGWFGTTSTAPNGRGIGGGTGLGTSGGTLQGCLGGWGGDGGSGGTGPTAGGTGGISNPPADRNWMEVFHLLAGGMVNRLDSGLWKPFRGGAPGGSGGMIDTGACRSGGGGGGGGVIWIAAPEITLASGCYVYAAGGNGGDADVAGASPSGGGGGGGGGVIILIYHKLIDLTGGAALSPDGGNGGNGDHNGSTGGNGGYPGTTILVDLTSGLVTTIAGASGTDGIDG